MREKFRQQVDGLPNINSNPTNLERSIASLGLLWLEQPKHLLNQTHCFPDPVVTHSYPAVSLQHNSHLYKCE